MVARAAELAEGKGLDNLSFQVGNILDLPFEDNTFDVVMSCAVTEHLSDPVKAMSELGRVAKQGWQSSGITRTDWERKPVRACRVPPAERFIELFQRGFDDAGRDDVRRQGPGRRMLQEAGLTVDPSNDADRDQQRGYTPGARKCRWWPAGLQWIENLPLFDRVIEEGLTTRDELDAMCAEMREWATQPGTLCGDGRLQGCGAEGVRQSSKAGKQTYVGCERPLAPTDALPQLNCEIAFGCCCYSC